MPPHESFAAQPRTYRRLLVAIFTAVVVGTAIAWPHARLDAAAMVAMTCVLAAAIFPPIRMPSGGLSWFVTPTLGAACLLYDPATTFIGVTLGWTFGHTVFHQREWWKGLTNGFLSGFPSAVAAALVGVLRAHLPLAAAIAIAPVAVVATRRIVNLMLTSVIANARWGMPIVPTFAAKISEDIVEETAEVTCFIPIAVGTVLLPDGLWWLLLVVSLPLNWLSTTFEVPAYRRRTSWGQIGDAFLPVNDSRLKVITTQLSQGAAVVDPDGALMGISAVGLQLFGAEALPPGSLLRDLCVAEDAARVDELVKEACLGWAPRHIDVRVRTPGGMGRWLTLTAENRFADPAVHGVAILVHEVSDENRWWRTLGKYADYTFATPLVQALEDERRWIAQRVDSLRQILAMAQLAVARPQSQDDPTPRDLLQQALAAARSVERALAPPELSDLGVLAAIQTYTDELRTAGLAVILDATGYRAARLARDVELVAYRVVQWALDNVARHAGVTSAIVELSISEGRLRVAVTDHGRGFHPDEIRTLGGLTQMEGRVNLVGGTLTVTSAEGQGTQVRVDLPTGIVPAREESVAAHEDIGEALRFRTRNA